MNLSRMDSETREYFNKLPAAVKEQIMQTGLEFDSKSELADYFENTLRSGSDDE